MLLAIVDSSVFRSISHYEWREPVLLTGRAARLRTLCTCGRTLFPVNRGWGRTTTEVCRENWWDRTALEEHGVKAGIRTGRWQGGRACRQITWPTAARVSVSQGDTDTKIKTTHCCRRESFVHLSRFGRIKTVLVYYDQWICRQHQG